ncbi:MAG: DsbA family protein [Nevskia sp.]|nr:DsbA family protein [Nevskia sp.]
MQRLKIDFVSDVACPWCAIGLGGLIAAVDRLAGKLEVELTFQPFELNRNMPPEGENLGEHMVAKYELTAAQIAENNAQITALAAEPA